MKNLLLVTGSIVALVAATPAFSADLAAQPVYTKAPPAPPAVATAIYDWSGFYIGANGGWGSSHSSWDLAGLTSEGSHDVSGGTIGGQIGYRSQIGQTVFGIEGQGNWADLTGSNISIAFPADINRTKTNGFGLITGLIGFTSNNVLLYAKGGAAVTSNTYQVTSTLTGAQLANTNSTRWGATVGAGVEVGFAPNWSVGVEYDHLFMPDGNVNFTTGTGTVTTDRIRQDFDLVTARLNYKFSPMVLKY
ncbi:outer membrane protein [Bradyrhizobium neotropicale]|uniref:outer membrane protein n=1 Tax=Bradyrhizobium neotropicale TaxID=1497615 RepID=UPI001AD74D64|nr:outer membrane beta-barrel protein [Bradyrhizobium neotropicale]MBO4228510.1 outer membrane beta-barrel protein [Bradyrhizobium neotropicale]